MNRTRNTSLSSEGKVLSYKLSFKAYEGFHTFLQVKDNAQKKLINEIQISYPHYFPSNLYSLLVIDASRIIAGSQEIIEMVLQGRKMGIKVIAVGTSEDLEMLNPEFRGNFTVHELNSISDRSWGSIS
jgi:hypothetical protein